MNKKFGSHVAALVLVCMCGVSAIADTQADKPKAASSGAKVSKAVSDTAINWMQFDAGLAKAKKEKKHMFVDFTTAWCGWCKKMEAETFSRPEVIKYVNDNFIAAKVIGDSDKELDLEGYKISERNLTTGSFKVTGFPAFAFLTPEGISLGVLPGYRPKDAMMEVFEFVKEKKYDTSKAAAQSNEKQPEKK